MPADRQSVTVRLRSDVIRINLPDLDDEVVGYDGIARATDDDAARVAEKIESLYATMSDAEREVFEALLRQAAGP